MTKKVIIFGVCFLFLAGCAQCLSMRSEYYDVSGKVFAPKTSWQEVEIFSDKLDRPYEEIGFIKVLARYGTSRKVLDQQLKMKASDAGADAIIEVQYGEDKSNEIFLCGKITSTKRNAVAVGKAVVFTDKKEGNDGR